MMVPRAGAMVLKAGAGATVLMRAGAGVTVPRAGGRERASEHDGGELRTATQRIHKMRKGQWRCVWGRTGLA